MSSSWAVTIEYRKPNCKAENDLFGRTYIKANNCMATVFINSNKRRPGEAMNTFFHEMSHVYNQLIGTYEWSKDKDELNARLVGDTVEALIKRFHRG